MYHNILFSIDSSFNEYEKRCFDFIKFINSPIVFNEFRKSLDQFILTNSKTMDLEYIKLNHGINTHHINKITNIGGIFNSQQEALSNARRIAESMFKRLPDLNITIYIVELCKWLPFNNNMDFSTKYKSKQISVIKKSPYARNQQYCMISFFSLNNVLYDCYTFYLWKYLSYNKHLVWGKYPRFNEFHWKFQQYQIQNREKLDTEYGIFCDEKLKPSLAQRHIMIYNGYDDTMEEQHNYSHYYHDQHTNQNILQCCTGHWISIDDDSQSVDCNTIVQFINDKKKKKRLLLKNLCQLINQCPIDLLYKIRWYF